jgi:hypothetical protein
MHGIYTLDRSGSFLHVVARMSLHMIAVTLSA